MLTDSDIDRIVQGVLAGLRQPQGNPLKTFIDTVFYLSPDPCVPLSDFFKEFLAFLPASERKAWTKSRIKSELPPPLKMYGESVQGIKRKPQ